MLASLAHGSKAFTHTQNHRWHFHKYQTSSRDLSRFGLHRPITQLACRSRSKSPLGEFLEVRSAVSSSHVNGVLLTKEEFVASGLSTTFAEQLSVPILVAELDAIQSKAGMNFDGRQEFRPQAVTIEYDFLRFAALEC